MRRLLRSAFATAVCVALFLCPTETSAQVPWTVVMSGLDNPRGLTIVNTGRGHNDAGFAIYVAEAGKGGADMGSNCLFIRGFRQCSGPTGAVSRYRDGVQTRVVEGLPSYAPTATGGAGATGPHDVSFSGRRRGYVVIGLGGDPRVLRPVFGNGFGWTVRFNDSGEWSYDVDISAHEVAANPDGGAVDTNPHGLLEGAGRRIVIDAGGNSMLHVRGNGSISTLATFPSRPQGRFTDAVPTSVVRGRGGYYVGELTGVPFVPASSNIYRVRPNQPPDPAFGNFSFIIDLDTDRAGNFYVLEHSSAPFPVGSGKLWRVAPDGTRTLLTDLLTNPTSAVLGRDCAVYISNRGTSPATGEVIRFPLADCPVGQDDQEGADD